LDTAVETATRAIDALRSASEPHAQVAIVEVSGHDAGWVALMSGIAGDADVVLIPEIPYDLDRVVERLESGSHSSRKLDVIVIAEGCKPVGGTVSNIHAAQEGPAPRHDASGTQLARLLEGRIGHEVRVTTLGHLQRGGSPTSFDRLLGARFGVHAAELCYHDTIGHMVTLRGQDTVSVPLEAAVGNNKRVPPDGELVAVARSLGIELGQA
jgi:6-phosphofructokinase 1